MRSIEENLVFLHQILTDRSVPVLEAFCTEQEGSEKKTLEDLYTELTTIREILHRFAQGDFDEKISVRGAVAGYLKTLQANLRHLTWQVEQVAEGDFSQRVDFMGDFSKAFNSLTGRLERSMEEQKEREASERTQIMLDATPLCCSFWDENMNNIDCNLEAVKLFGLKCKQEYLDRFQELSPEFQPSGHRSSELILEEVRQAFQTGRSTFQWMHQKPDGEPIPAEITLVRVWQRDHFIVVGYTRDLRQLKKTEDALERESLLRRDILDTSPICFSILVDGHVRFATPFMRDFLGIDVGDSLSDYMEGDRSAFLLDEAFREGQAIQWLPVTMRTKSGETKEMLANIDSTDYYGEKGLMVWLVDVTEIRRIEADLRHARDVAEDSARVKGEFMANMSHEIRTPMNAILGMMHLVRQTPLSDKQLIYVETTEKSARLLLRIINDILDFSKIEAGRLDMEKAVFSVRTTVEEVATVMEESAEKKNLLFSYKIDPKLPALVLGDPVRLKQVLFNLLSNAIKFTAQGEVTLDVRLDRDDHDRVRIRFTVRDTGIGISKKERRRLFTPFMQADASTTRKYGGTGLGLAICKRLVEMMHGTIRCRSRENEGSTFTFTARFDLSKKETSASRTGEPVGEEARYEVVPIPEPSRGLSILLAEDNRINQLVATELLVSQGFQVDVADDGRKAVDMAERKKYDLVLMDIQMPELDGLQATRLIRQNPALSELPILAMTANTTSDDRQRCLEAGMNDHISKPIEPEQLYRSVIKWTSADRTGKPSEREDVRS